MSSSPLETLLLSFAAPRRTTTGDVPIFFLASEAPLRSSERVLAPSRLREHLRVRRARHSQQCTYPKARGPAERVRLQLQTHGRGDGGRPRVARAFGSSASLEGLPRGSGSLTRRWEPWGPSVQVARRRSTAPSRWPGPTSERSSRRPVQPGASRGAGFVRRPAPGARSRSAPRSPRPPRLGRSESRLDQCLAAFEGPQLGPLFLKRAPRKRAPRKPPPRESAPRR